MSLPVTLDWRHSTFSKAEFARAAKKLAPALDEMKRAVKNRDWKSPYASLLLPSEKRFLNESLVLSRAAGTPSLLVVNGIGGSNLGTKAVQHAVLGENPLRCAVVYADTLDPDDVAETINHVRHPLHAERGVIINVISKSGTTTETVANAAALIDALPPHPRSAVVATTDPNSKLEFYARARRHPVLYVPKSVGGRYSVFSNVGLYPLTVMGLNTAKLLDGANEAVTACLQNDWHKNPAAILALFLYLNKKEGRNIHDSFVWSKCLQSQAEWYRQLLAESCGKNGEGLRPTTSIGSTDLHSVAQLDLGGPDDTSYRFISLQKSNREVRVPPSRDLNALVPHVAGKTFTQLMTAIRLGTLNAFAKAKRPFVSVQLRDRSPETVGALLQTEMMEVMLFARLNGVNAFDQPAVESYKEETRKLLARR